MRNKLNLCKGLTLGDGSRAITVEKVNSENIYLRLKDGNQRRILPTQLILDLLHHLRNKKITIDDIFRKKRKENNLPPLFDALNLDYENFILGYESSISKICEYELDFKSNSSNKPKIDYALLPKPFILLAGISGTGKTRFILEQAKNSADKFNLEEDYNCCLVPVRPDWHEPSDLLGYISRISGTHYISTDFLIFIVKAWCNAIESADNQIFQLKPIEDIAPFWLCLDEMNLAPVEQYFADYLAILETRKWQDGHYFCQPIMKKEVLGKLRHSNTTTGINSMDSLWSEIFKDIDVDDSFKEALCDHFEFNGIALPPNLIVAGTVNMDETTHGFSRKVIDRALTIDFQEFFPNDYEHFFEPKTQAKLLSFPVYAQVKQENFTDIKIDSDGTKTKVFLGKINEVLKDTPFELAFRALNEILLSTVSFNPKTEADLMAVWDDFLMQKVLPRIEGDMSKLRYISPDGIINKADSKDSILEEKHYGKGSVLHTLYVLLSHDNMLGLIWKEAKRPDLLRESISADGKESPSILIECRTKKKLEWMMRRLKSSHFTNFWV